MDLIPFEERLDKLINKETQDKKTLAWGGFGKQLYRGELALQLRGQDIINRLPKEVSIESINETEEIVKQAQKELDAHVEDRKFITKNFDPVIARLMQPEKDVSAALVATKNLILLAKQQREQAAKTKQAKEDELRRVKAQVLTYTADMHSSILNALLNLISNAYKHALETETPIADIPAFIQKVKDQRVTTASVTVPLPIIKAVFNTQEDIDACVKENFKPWTPEQYKEGFAVDIDKKFYNWEDALRNKPRALELNIEETKETEAAIIDQKENEQLGAKLESIAAPVEDSADKALKKVFAIKAAETLNDAFAIAAAFLVNRQLTEPALRKITPENLSIKQMRAALETIKNNDNAFETTGITFKLIDKL